MTPTELLHKTEMYVMDVMEILGNNNEESFDDVVMAVYGEMEFLLEPKKTDAQG